QNRAVKENILSPGELSMKTGADFQQTRNSTANVDPATGRFGDPADDFQERRFSGTVAADDADDFACLDLNTESVKSPEFLLAVAVAVSGAERRQRRSNRAFDRVSKSVAIRLSADDIALRKIRDLDGGFAHFRRSLTRSG